MCFNEGRAGERVNYKSVEFSQEVVSAEVFLSGFNMWYTREGHDHEVMQLRVDAWVDHIGVLNPEFMTEEEIKKAKRSATIKLMYAMTDEDTSDSDDFNDACIGFTVIALTKPLR